MFLSYTQIEAVSGVEARTRSNSYTTLCVSASRLTIQIVSYQFFSSCGCHLLLPLQAGLFVVHPSPVPPEKGKFYSGLKCCDVMCFSLSARTEYDSTSKLFKLYFHKVSAICWPWYIWISRFGLKLMACFSKTKMEKRFLVVLLLAIKLNLYCVVPFA